MAWTEFQNPAAWAVAVILLIMPLIANGFFLIEIFGTTLILGIIALSQIKQSGEQGRGFAIAGIAIGAVILALTLILVIAIGVNL